MKHDAFTAGVIPGGLMSQSDIRILVCYMIKSIPSELMDEEIIEAIQRKGLANYFEVVDAINILSKNGHILKDSRKCLFLSKEGKDAVDSIENILPTAVKEKAIETALTLLNLKRNIKDNPVEINEIEKGYEVICHVSGGDFDLMKICLYAPDLSQAEYIKSNFQKNPSYYYELMLSSLMNENVE